jgi:pimeloyl-ACP methyl ester carboxylesterase
VLNHVRRGSGEPLVLIHPLGAELVVWEPVLERLARERDVIALDLPGFGGSPALSNGAAPTPRTLAAAVGVLLDELGLERAHVAGNSLGGWVSLELARAGRALSVAGLCTAGFWRRPLGPRPGADVRRVGRALLPALPALLRSARGRRLVLRGTVARPERVPPEAAARLVRAYVTSPGFEGANAAMRAAVISGIDEIRVPVTLAWGDRDRLVMRPRHGVPGWRTVTLRGCGHIPTWDDPDQVARELLLASA